MIERRCYKCWSDDVESVIEERPHSRGVEHVMMCKCRACGNEWAAYVTICPECGSDNVNWMTYGHSRKPVKRCTCQDCGHEWEEFVKKED